MSEKIYRVPMNSKGMPDFSKAVEVPSTDHIGDSADMDRTSLREWAETVLDKTYEAFNGVKGFISEISGAEDAWIPCSERLPERPGNYLCTCIDQPNDRRTTVVKWSNRWWLTGSRTYWIVIAWMPLPEPWGGADYE